MGKSIAYITGVIIFVGCFISGVILNFVVMGASGKSFFEIITLNKLGSALLVWSYAPVLCAILLAGCIAGAAIMGASKRR